VSERRVVATMLWNWVQAAPSDPPSLRSCVGEVSGAQSQGNASVRPDGWGIVAAQRMVLFYNAETRTGATARIDADGVLGEPGS
jgi:hypothetical protein